MVTRSDHWHLHGKHSCQITRNVPRHGSWHMSKVQVITAFRITRTPWAGPPSTTPHAAHPGPIASQGLLLTQLLERIPVVSLGQVVKVTSARVRRGVKAIGFEPLGAVAASTRRRTPNSILYVIFFCKPKQIVSTLYTKTRMSRLS